MAEQANTATNAPLPTSRLNQIATDACESALSLAEGYNHARVGEWNTDIINKILQSLISETSAGGNPPIYKYAVNSTIIQHISSPARKSSHAAVTSTSTVGANEATGADSTHPVAGGVSDERTNNAKSGSQSSHVGRRGMHSATGAYWNNEKDGMWSFKYEAGEAKGFDVVISILWISI